MTEAEKKIADAVKNGQTTIEGEAETEAKTEEETGEDASTEEGEDDGADDESADTSDKDIDYEAELQKERDARIKAEQAAADASFKLRDKKRKDKGDDDQDDEIDEDKPLTARELRGILAQERQVTQKTIQGDLIRSKARQLAGPKASQAEIDLIVERHNNRSFPEGLSLDDQIEEVYAGIHRRKILGQNSELKRALRSKDTTAQAISSTHRESPAAGVPKLPAQDLSALKAAGYGWDGKSRLFIKKLAGGKKTLFYDPKAKKRWVA